MLKILRARAAFTAFLAIGAAGCASLSLKGVTSAMAPDQPKSGPGGSDYRHADITVDSGGSGVNAWYVFQPTRPRPASAPLVVMMHGYTEYEGFEMHEEFVRHTVRKGNVVIYPRWQTGPFTPCAAGRQIEECVTSALRGIRGGIAWLQSRPSSRVQPDLARAAYFGFSFGGIITTNLTNRYATLGLPEPKVIFLDDPHDGGMGGAPEAAVDPSLAGIPATTKFVCHSSAKGVISMSAKLDHSCNAIFPKLGHIPEGNKDLVMLYPDDHGSPRMRAEHGVCTSWPLPKDAYDYYFCWKQFDALRSAAFDGTDEQYALGDTPEHRFTGVWSDGVPIRELKIQKAAPIVP
jgi:hypothetical protein